MLNARCVNVMHYIMMILVTIVGYMHKEDN